MAEMGDEKREAGVIYAILPLDMSSVHPCRHCHCLSLRVFMNESFLRVLPPARDGRGSGGTNV